MSTSTPATRLLALAKRHGLSHMAVARALRVHINTVSNWSGGMAPSEPNLKAIARLSAKLSRKSAPKAKAA